MHPRKLQLDRHGPRTRLALVVLLTVGLAGCATELTLTHVRPSTEAAAYVGVFTGEFVDGKPLYRFPTIEVLGSRSGAVPGT